MCILYECACGAALPILSINLGIIMRDYLKIAAPTANPVLTAEFAERISSTSNVAKVDLHETLEDMFLGTSPMFTADTFRSIAWRVDATLKNQLKQVARKLPMQTEQTIDSLAEIDMKLDEMWGSELNSYENGYESTGALHMIVACRNIRNKFHEDANRVANAAGRHYEVQSIEVQIASPEKQEITRNMLANFEFEALKVGGILSDPRGRGEFRDGINWGAELISINRQVRDYNPTYDEYMIERTLSAKPEFTALIEKRAKLPHKVVRALNHLELLISAQEALHEKWYEGEIKLVSLMIHTFKWCDKKLELDAPPQFYDLPASIQIDCCTIARGALERALNKFTSKSPRLYSTYSFICDAAYALIDKIIAARMEGEGSKEVSQWELDEQRADKRTSLALDDGTELPSNNGTAKRVKRVQAQRDE